MPPRRPPRPRQPGYLNSVSVNFPLALREQLQVIANRRLAPVGSVIREACARFVEQDQRDQQEQHEDAPARSSRRRTA